MENKKLNEAENPALQQGDVMRGLNPKFDFSFINVDCQICGANSKIDEVEESICPKCGGIILIPIYYE